MKREILQLLIIFLFSIISVYYFIREDYWFALIMIIPVGAIILDWARKEEITEKQKSAK